MRYVSTDVNEDSSSEGEEGVGGVINLWTDQMGGVRGERGGDSTFLLGKPEGWDDPSTVQGKDLKRRIRFMGR